MLPTMTVAWRPTHQENRNFESLGAGIPEQTKNCRILDIVFESDLTKVNCAIDRSECSEPTVFDSWITGPSAMGSENGTPSSITSAPPLCIDNRIGTVSSVVG